MISTDPDSPVESRSTARRAARLTLTGIAGASAVAVLVGVMGGIASATPSNSSDTGSTVGNVDVQSSIVLSNLTEGFTLTGIPRDTVTGVDAVSMNVETNNLAGYNVTVQSASSVLAPHTSGNPDSIPIADLGVRESGTGSFTPVSDSSTVTVHNQDTRSAQGGDTVNNDYQVAIPFVNQDVYSTTLDYIATAN
jgi:hypothetical protein